MNKELCIKKFRVKKFEVKFHPKFLLLPACFYFSRFLFTGHAQWSVVIEATKLGLHQNILVGIKTLYIKMIPPNASLVKYDNPVLVSRNTDKKTPRVCL